MVEPSLSLPVDRQQLGCDYVARVRPERGVVKCPPYHTTASWLTMDSGGVRYLSIWISVESQTRFTAHGRTTRCFHGVPGKILGADLLADRLMVLIFEPPLAISESRLRFPQAAQGADPRDDRRCIEGLLLGAGPRGVASPLGPPYVRAADHSSGAAGKRARIATNHPPSAAIAALSGTSA
jgi:hypothetical protein